MFDLHNFDVMIGNVHTLSLIQRMLYLKTFPNFSILSGVFGTGKSTCAKIAAMTLTCDNPAGYNPCGVCETCKANKQAFKTTGESGCVKIVNLGILANKTEMNELIRDIFVLQGGKKARVYVLEEAHVLKGLNNAQTALLEEIDRMPKNTYVIMCTTKVYDIIPELVSRAMPFNFTKVNSSEATLIVNRTSSGCLSKDLVSMIVNYSRGIPRDLVKNTEFVMNNDITEEEFREYTSDISNEYLMLLFDSMSDRSIVTFVGMLEELCDDRAPDVIVRALKSFVLEVIFAIEGAKTLFNEEEVKQLNELFSIVQLNKMLTKLEQLRYSVTEIDVKMLLYEFRLIMQNRTVKSVVEETQLVASVEKERGKIETLNQQVMDSGERSVLRPITTKSIRI